MPSKELDFDYWRNLPEAIGIGVISGTSMDGIDVAIVKFFAQDKKLPEILWFSTIPYAPDLAEILKEISVSENGSTELITRANWAAGHAFADAVLQVIAESVIDRQEIQFIGSHGQTIQHLPHAGDLAGYPGRGTLQIGEPAVIAHKTGILTVADFRAADIAAGGQGAPLVPYFDFTFFKHETESRILLNIGGIANFTYLPNSAKIQDVIAFDCGPGNMLIDGLMWHFFGMPFDENGKIAAKGTINKELLAKLNRHPYFDKPWPKSTGKEEFGDAFIKEICQESEKLAISANDVIATVTQFSAETIALAIRKSLQSQRINTIIVSGGGRHNQTLMSMFEQQLESVSFLPIDATGISSDAKEAVCFAHLALTTLQAKPANIPNVTGAKRSVILGKICFS